METTPTGYPAEPQGETFNDVTACSDVRRYLSPAETLVDSECIACEHYAVPGEKEPRRFMTLREAHVIRTRLNRFPDYESEPELLLLLHDEGGHSSESPLTIVRINYGSTDELAGFLRRVAPPFKDAWRAWHRLHPVLSLL